MATTVHLPPDLLEQIDRRAGELGISRNRYIVRALEDAVEGETGWSQSFLDMMADAARDTESHEAVDEMMRAISSRRTSKRPPKL
jgi:predicted transcriptional regulator